MDRVRRDAVDPGTVLLPAACRYGPDPPLWHLPAARRSTLPPRQRRWAPARAPRAKPWPLSAWPMMPPRRRITRQVWCSSRNRKSRWWARTLSRLERQDVTQPGIRVEDQTFDSADLNYLSGVYPFRLLARNVVVSLNFQRLFDLKGATDVAAPFTTIDGLQQVRSRQEGGLFTISPAVAVEITPAFSAGIAFNIWPDLFGNGWTQDVTVRGQGFVASGPRAVPFVSNGRIAEDFSFQGFNVTIGLLWNISPIFTLGGVVRTPFTAG